MDKAKRDAIAARLEKIAGLNGGRLTPDAVLKDAQSFNSPLHDQFEWDDGNAAQQWRLQQARELIRSVKVEFQTDTKIVSTVRYVRDPAAGDSQGYVEVAKLRDERGLAREALKRELGHAMSLFARAKSLAEVFALQDEIVSISGQIEQVNVKLDEAA